MMDDPELLFSPWFRIITNKWVLGGKDNDNNDQKGWWDDLSVTMNTDTFVDVENILRFDPPKEHMGGEGDAGPLFGGAIDDDETTDLIGDAS